MKTDLQQLFIVQLLTTTNALWRESRRFFKPFGLTEAQFNVLNLVAAHDQGLSQREISDLLLVDRSNITVLLDRMIARGWLSRRDDPKDRRIYRIALTTQGKNLWKKTLPAYLTALDKIFVSFSVTELRTTHDLLKKLEKQASAWNQ